MNQLSGGGGGDSSVTSKDIIGPPAPLYIQRSKYRVEDVIPQLVPSIGGKARAPHQTRRERVERRDRLDVPDLSTVCLTTPTHHLFFLRLQVWFAELKETRCRHLAPRRRNSHRQAHNRRRAKSPSSASSKRSQPTHQVPHRPNPHQRSRHPHRRYRKSRSLAHLLLSHQFPAAMHLNPRVRYGSTRRILQ